VKCHDTRYDTRSCINQEE